MKTIPAFLWKDLLEEADYPTGVLFRYLFILLNVSLFYFLNQWLKPVGQDSFSYFLTGWSFFLLTHRGLERFVQSIRREMNQETLENFWCLGISPLALFTALAAWPFLDSVLQMGFSLLVGRLIFHGSVPYFGAPIFWLSAGLGVSIYFSVGLGIGAWTILSKRGDSAVSLFSFVTLVLGGVFYPAKILPKGLSLFSQGIPLTHLLKLVRGEEAALGVGGLIFFSVFIFMAGVFLLHSAFWKVRRDGTLHRSST